MPRPTTVIISDTAYGAASSATGMATGGGSPRADSTVKRLPADLQRRSCPSRDERGPPTIDVLTAATSADDGIDQHPTYAGYEFESVRTGQFLGDDVVIRRYVARSVDRTSVRNRRGGRYDRRDGRHACRAGRPRAQPEERLDRAATRSTDRLHRAVGLGQVLARVRHDLRRGAAPLRRVAVGLRPAVPRPDGQARRRLHRGPVAGDLDRPEVRVAQPSVDRRHDHRGLRLPAPSLRPHRGAALPERRHAASSGRRPSRSSTGCSTCPTAPASRCSRRSCGAARASTSTLLADLSAQGYVRARIDGEVRELSEVIGDGDRAGPVRAAHHRGRRRPAREARRHRAPAHRLARDGAAAGRGRRRGADRAEGGRRVRARRS